MSLDELVSILLLLLLLFLAQAITTTSRAELAIDCPPSNCSQSGPKIRLPLSLNSAPGYSQSPSPSPSPSPSGGGGGSSNVVVAVDYHRGLIKLSRPWSTCPWQTNSTNDSYPSFSYYCLRRFESIDFPDCYYSCFMDSTDYTLTKCTAELASSIIGNESIAGPIPCLSGTGGGYFVYAVDSSNMPIDSLTYYCSVVSKGTAGSTDDRTQNLTFREKILEDFSRTVPWDYDINDRTLCGGSCRYNQATNQTLCISNNQDDNHGELCS